MDLDNFVLFNETLQTELLNSQQTQK